MFDRFHREMDDKQNTTYREDQDEPGHGKINVSNAFNREKQFSCQDHQSNCPAHFLDPFKALKSLRSIPGVHQGPLSSFQHVLAKLVRREILIQDL